MGDFLGNIVAESLNLRQVVRPRPVSRFEPVQPAGHPAWAPPDEEEVWSPPAAPGESEATYTEPTPSRPGRQPDLRPPTLPEVSPLRPAGILGRDVPGPPAPRRISPPDLGPELGTHPRPPQAPVPEATNGAPGPRQPGQPPRAFEKAPPVAAALRPELEPRGESTAPRTEGLPGPLVAEGLSPAPVDLPRSLPGPTPESGPPPKIEIKPAIERLIHKSPKGPAGPSGESVQTTPPTSRPTQPGARGRVAGPSAPEPTIQVTIGRIEVRATRSVEPPPKRPAAPKPMGLDEYLRQRHERGRR